MATPEKKKTSMGLEENVASGLCYIAGFITGLIFYFSEKDNKTVKFHALQSIGLSIFIVGVWIVIAIFNAIFFAISWTVLAIWGVICIFIWLGVLALWVFLIVIFFAIYQTVSKSAGGMAR